MNINLILIIFILLILILSSNKNLEDFQLCFDTIQHLCNIDNPCVNNYTCSSNTFLYGCCQPPNFTTVSLKTFEPNEPNKSTESNESNKNKNVINKFTDLKNTYYNRNLSNI